MSEQLLWYIYLGIPGIAVMATVAIIAARLKT
jgi:hypothetical protein